MEGYVLHLHNVNIAAFSMEVLSLRNTTKPIGLYDRYLEGDSNQRFSI